jgi:hypothetical protein
MFFFFCKHFSLEFQQLNEFQIASHIFLSFFGSKLHILQRTSFSRITLFRWCKIALWYGANLGAQKISKIDMKISVQRIVVFCTSRVKST